MRLNLVENRPNLNLTTPVRLHWSTIFSGAFLTLAFGFFFLFLGNSIGLTAVNTIDTGISGALKFWSWVYMAVTMTFSYFLGALISSRSASVHSHFSGIIHGLTSWAVVSTVTVAAGVFWTMGAKFPLLGFATDAANWLATCIVGIGAGAAAVGGLMGNISNRVAISGEISGDESLERRSV